VLVDQFGTETMVVEQPQRLCSPVDKNGGGIRQADVHLVCYQIEVPHGKSGNNNDNGVVVFTRDQFGLLTLKVQEPETLCVPSSKRVL
jgi:hypothetical protein